MSFLTPFYVLGILAVGLPIIFHLIQRRPKGQTMFSSLMFLRPSPPRLTRRSRLDNLLLLFLRALAVTLIALAFSRPFLRSIAQLGFETPARKTFVLVDTSASMRRDGIQEAVRDQIEKIGSDIGARDSIALAQFNDEVSVMMGFSDQASTSHGSRAATLIRKASRELTPTWKATNLGKALVTACEELRSSAESNERQVRIPPRVVLITDLQRGSNLEALDAFEWPSEVMVDLRVVSPSTAGNTWLKILGDDQPTDSDNEVRVRVGNTAESKKQRFALRWKEDDESPLAISLQSGQSRVFSLPKPAKSNTLLLDGDQCNFDNQAFLALPSPIQKKLVFVGGSEDTPDNLAYFLRRVSFDTPRRHVEIVVTHPNELDKIDVRTVPLVVVGKGLTNDVSAHLQDVIDSGGNVLAVLDLDSPLTDASLDAWRKLTQQETLTMENIANDKYAILGEVDFDHPLFSPLAEAQYNDFTKIHFWRHQRLSASSEEPWRVLARFDDGSPALIEQRREKGTLWLLAAGWQPSHSQLAVSTKFVPLLHGLFNLSDAIERLDTGYLVGEPVGFTQDESQRTVVGPDGKTHDIGSATEFNQTDLPGNYTVSNGKDSAGFAVNIDPDESLTDAMDPSELEQRGISFGGHETLADMEERERQMRDIELESRQRIWRILVLAAIAVLGLETWIAARKS